ncbi:MAG: HEAT repeat domain-containing protein, partial [Planctomycetota bacterium]
IRNNVMQAKAATAELAALGEPAIPALQQLLEDKDPLHHQWAVMGFLQIGTERANRLAIEQLEQGHPEARKVAAWYARSSKSDKVRKALVARLDDEKNPGVMFWVLRAITESGPKRFPDLGDKFPAFLRGGDEKLQVLAVNGLVAWKPEGWLDMLVAQADRETKPGVIVKLLDTYAGLKQASEKVAPKIRAALDHQSRTIRLKAAVAYRQLGPDDVSTVLLGRLKVEDDPKVKAGLLALVKKTGDRRTEVIDQLVNALKDDDPKVQMYAVAILRAYTGKSFGYSPSGTPEEKAKALEAWTTWWTGARKTWKPKPAPQAP